VSPGIPTQHKSLSGEDIQTFCPAKICLGHHVFDGLLDSVDGDYGGLYLMTDDLQILHRGGELEGLLSISQEAEISFHHAVLDGPIPCQIQGSWQDEDGLLAYVRVRFPKQGGPERSALDALLATWW